MIKLNHKICEASKLFAFDKNSKTYLIGTPRLYHLRVLRHPQRCYLQSGIKQSICTVGKVNAQEMGYFYMKPNNC